MEISTTSDIYFQISGPALTYLFDACEKGKTDKMGFLLGEKRSYVRLASDFVNDSGNFDTEIEIFASLPVSTPSLFCDNTGKVDYLKLRNVLGPFGEEVVGWYNYKINSGLSPLFQIAMLHKEFLNALPQVTPQSFIFCNIGGDVSSSVTTDHKYVLLRYINGKFQPLFVKIDNMGVPSYFGSERYSTSVSSYNIGNILTTFNLNSDFQQLSLLNSLQQSNPKIKTLSSSEVQTSDQRAQRLLREIEKLTQHKDEKVLKKSINLPTISKEVTITSTSSYGRSHGYISAEEFFRKLNSDEIAASYYYKHYLPQTMLSPGIYTNQIKTDEIPSGMCPYVAFVIEKNKSQKHKTRIEGKTEENVCENYIQRK